MRAHPAQGVLDLAVLSGNEAALDTVELITHRRALRLIQYNTLLCAKRTK